MTLQQIQQEIAWLKSKLDSREIKYRRNNNRYSNSGFRDESVRALYGAPFGMWARVSEEDLSPPPINHVIKNAIDTYTSKMSQTKVRPYFLPVEGGWKARKACRGSQQYFDEAFEAHGVNRLAIMALRDALEFEVGYVWIDEEKQRPFKLPPWEAYIDPAEAHYDAISRAYIRQEYYPLSALEPKLKKSSRLQGYLARDRTTKCVREIYYDLAGKMRYEIVDNEIIGEVKLQSPHCPIRWIFYNAPSHGMRTTSMLDDLYPIQITLDMIWRRIKDAAELTPANTVYLSKALGDLKKTKISNRIGEVVEYTPIEGGQPPVVSTPRPIDPMFLQLAQHLESMAYNTVGISQLSAQAKKPSGLNSGRALETLEDVESERHNLVLQDYIRFLVDIAKTMIEVLPDDADVLPRKVGRAKVSWKDVKAQRDLFSIQFSATSSLSKDPKTKLEQIEKLLQMGFVDKDFAASLLEMPDIEESYAITTAAHDAAQRIIERALDGEAVTFNETINLELLMRECVVTTLRLDAADEDQETIERVIDLMRQVKIAMDKVAAELAPPPLPAQPVPEMVPAAPVGPVAAPPPVPGAPI